MTAVSKNHKAIDPRDDVSGTEFKEDMLFFVMHGGRNLMRALFWQTIRDLVQSRSHPDAPDLVHTSALWPKTEAGRSTIAFLMPGISVDVIIAKIYENPQRFIDEMSNVDKAGPTEQVLKSESSVVLDHDVAASAYGEKPECSEDDQPLAIGEPLFDTYSHDAPGQTSWG